MKDILKTMIFFRKKKKPVELVEKPKPALPVKKAAPSPATKHEKSFQEIVSPRILTAEGWRRLMEKKTLRKK